MGQARDGVGHFNIVVVVTVVVVCAVVVFAFAIFHFSFRHMIRVLVFSFTQVFIFLWFFCFVLFLTKAKLTSVLYSTDLVECVFFLFMSDRVRFVRKAKRLCNFSSS